MDPIGFQTHDHSHCIEISLAAADKTCCDKGLQLTPVRRRVLEILLQKHCAMGAYEVLDQLRSDGLGSQPPVAYRALDFLVSHGFAHRIERLNAFVACMHPAEAHAPVFLICTTCSAVVEAPGRSVADALQGTARALGFEVTRAAIEAEGLCPGCQSEADT